MATYEWDVEEVQVTADFRDVVEHNFQPSFNACKRFVESYGAPVSGIELDVVLVRNGADGRSWAYMENGKLPEFFEDAYGREVAKVPNRFHKEAAQ